MSFRSVNRFTIIHDQLTPLDLLKWEDKFIFTNVHDHRLVL